MIAIGVPVPKDYAIDVRTAAYCSAESQRPDVKWGYVASRDAGVGRSTFTYYALKDSEVTHVYFVDYDVVPPERTLQRLLEYDFPVVSGIYPMRVDGEDIWSFKIGRDWWSKDKPIPNGPLDASAVGGGVLLVKREVFECLTRPYFKIVYKAMDVKGKCFDEGEDEYFSRIAREAGYKLIVDPSIVCEHCNYGNL